jgi:ferredoxin-thioredoxin reductase catalytic chain
MTDGGRMSEERIDALHARLDREARQSGYNLNPDEEMTRTLVEGLLVNTDRVGYMCCPCRIPAGDRRKDLDIICPCDYRDPDLADWGSCYCALYVAEDVLSGERDVQSIPERRPPEGQRPHERSDGRVSPGGSGKDDADAGRAPGEEPAGASAGEIRVWRCRVCGYLCAREQPPERCPICKASSERFELFRRP